MAKIFRTLRNHWKKSTFALALLSFGAQYGKTSYDNAQLMRTYCEEAVKYGNAPLPPGMRPRHVTVFLNPAANGGKATKLFDKYCAPLLHLAGLKVSVVKTESQKQAREYMMVMDNADAVVVAGGDGTASEIVTGLLRRQDYQTAIRRFPIGLLPLGKNSSVAKALFFNHDNNDVKTMADATMAVVREVLRPLDVMKIQTLETDESLPGKPVFALGQVEWGALREAESRRDKYWYWGALRSYATIFFSAFKDLSWDCNAEVKYTLPCKGCSKCYLERAEPRRTKRWWEAFLPKISHTQTVPVPDYSKVENLDCGLWQDSQVSTVNLSISTENVCPRCQRHGEKCLELAVAPESLGTLQFIQEGWKRIGDHSHGSSVQQLRAQEIKIIPQVANQTDKETMIAIDNEEFDLKPVHLKLLPKMIYVYHNPEQLKHQ